MRIIIVDNTSHPQNSHMADKTSTMLEAHGHQVYIYRLSNGSQQHNNIKTIFGLDGEPELFSKYLEKIRPDCVHIFNLFSAVSPALGRTAKRMGIRTICSLHDYKPLCPNGDCRTHSGYVCEDCLHGERHVITRRCVDGKTFPSFVALLSSLYWNIKRMEQCSDIFLVPTAFMRSKLLEAGFAASKIAILPIQTEGYQETISEQRDNYFCFSGNLTAESGIETLLHATLQSKATLKICGDGPLKPRIEQLATRGNNITFHRQTEMATLFSKAKGVIIPSETYLHGTQEIAFAHCCGTPVIASTLGELAESIDSSNGVTFSPGNIEELAAIMREFDKRHAFHYREIAQKARYKHAADRIYKNLTQHYI